MADKNKTALETFHSAVIASAAKAVMKEMTPDALLACAKDILSGVLRDLTHEYGAIRQMIRTEAEKIMKEYVATAGVQAQIRVAAEKGVNDALATLSEETRKKVLELAIKGMGEKIASAGRY